MTTNKAQAIQTALAGDWNTAILINKQLLKENPDDIETLNRLALAYTVIGKIKDAKHVYQKVLTLDNQNLIALKNAKRLNNLHKESPNFAHTSVLTGHIVTMFLEENGKTKVIELVNVAEPKVISHLMTGEIIQLHVKRLKIFVLDTNKHYIGMLPDDIGKRLTKFLKGGNIYEACIKAVVNHRVIVFIKEIKQMGRFKNQPSFPSLDKTKIIVARKMYQSEKEDVEEAESESDDV